jgi:DNA adenine methylase
MFEPFAGSAAASIAAADQNIADRFIIGDSLRPLTEIWGQILASPDEFADDYEAIWSQQLDDPRKYFLEVRDAFNAEGGATRLLFLLARCVKNSPRFNGHGEFNQSADHRRKGMNPSKMRREIQGASVLLKSRCEIRFGDFEDQLEDATSNDLVYLDPPWEGTTIGTDKRYHAGLARQRLVAVLEELDARAIPYLLSYDGRHGDKRYGSPLPESVGALRVELHAGRSSQATLNGEAVTTFESLYVSRHLRESLTPQGRLALLSEA